MKDQYNELCAAIQISSHKLRTPVQRPFIPPLHESKRITKADIAKAVAQVRAGKHGAPR